MKASSPSIRRTLLDELFRRPKPIARKQFGQARDYLFPGDSYFRRFLTTDDNQELTRNARTILLRLSYQNYASPPARLILNLADFEDGVREVVKEGDYIPRDHFVHLVNLYLLGLYLFSYHKSFHAACLTELQRAKRSFLKSTHLATGRTTGRLTSYHLFASVWGKFVLLHDLAYPLEKTEPSKRKENVRWLKPFTKIRKSILKDLSLEALSRLLILTSIVDDASLALGEVYLDHELDFAVAKQVAGPRRRYISVRREGGSLLATLPGEEGDWAIGCVTKLLDRWSAAQLLGRVRTKGALNLLGVLLPDRDLCAVLEAGSGAPVVVVFKDQAESPIWCQRVVDIPGWIPKDPRVLWSFAFAEVEPPSQDSRWQYFGFDVTVHLDEIISSIPGLKRETLEELLGNLTDDEEFRAVAGVESDAVAGEAFIAYERLSQMLGYLEDEENSDKSNRIFEAYSAGFESVSSLLPSWASDVITRELRAGIALDKTFRPGEILRTNERNDAVAIIANTLWGIIAKEGKQAFKAKLAGEITPHVTKRIKLGETVRDIHRSIRERLESLLPVGDESGNQFANAKFSSDFSLANIGSSGEGVERIDQELRRRGLGSLQELSSSYRPQWAKDAKQVSFIDHGLAAAYVCSSVATIFKDIAKALEVEEAIPIRMEIRLARLAVGTTSKADERWLAFEISAVESIVGFATAIHNLYPQDFEGQAAKYRSKLSREPFAFVALLADGLQKWDRKSLVNIPLSNARLSPAGSRFDLKVVGNLLAIAISAQRMNMEREEGGIRGILASYLDGADSLVRLDFREEI